MKKTFLIFVAIILMALSGCSPKNTITYSAPLYTEIIGTQAISAKKYVLDREGFDNRCKKEKISSVLDNWSKVAFRSYEDGTRFIEYFFINEDSLKGMSEKMYRLDLDIVKKDTTFILEVRTTKKVK